LIGPLNCSLVLQIVDWAFELFTGPSNCSLGLQIIHWSFKLFTGPLSCSLGLPFLANPVINLKKIKIHPKNKNKWTLRDKRSQRINSN
jgi:hypothetical protein